MTSSCNECPLGSATLPERCPFHASTRGAGELLIRQGEVPAAALFVKQGAVLVSSVGPTGEETSCAMRGAGALLGLELLTSSPSRYQVSALSAATVESPSVVSYPLSENQFFISVVVCQFTG